MMFYLLSLLISSTSMRVPMALRECSRLGFFRSPRCHSRLRRMPPTVLEEQVLRRKIDVSRGAGLLRNEHRRIVLFHIAVALALRQLNLRGPLMFVRNSAQAGR